MWEVENVASELGDLAKEISSQCVKEEFLFLRAKGKKREKLNEGMLNMRSWDWKVLKILNLLYTDEELRP